MSDRDPYATLGVDRDAAPAEIRAAFRRIVRERHPDTAGGVADGAEMRELVEAYRTLNDPSSRARHYAAEPGVIHPPGTGGRRVVVRRGTVPPPEPRSRAPRWCNRCDGSGVVRRAESCIACGGLGHIVSLDARRAGRYRCRDCGGRGSVVGSRPCQACAGSGVAS